MSDVQLELFNDAGGPAPGLFPPTPLELVQRVLGEEVVGRLVTDETMRAIEVRVGEILSDGDPGAVRARAEQLYYDSDGGGHIQISIMRRDSRYGGVIELQI